MQKLVFIGCFIFICSVAAVGQQRILSGYLKDSITHLPIVGGTLSNPERKTKIQTDVTGFFRLQVLPNDLLYAIATNYRYDTLRYSFLFQDTITVYLSPLNVMENVTIETGYPRYQMDSVQRRREFEQSRGTTLNTVDRSSSKPYFGLTLNLDRVFKKKYKNKEKDEQSFSYLEQRAYVNFRFSPQLVAFYTGLKGDALVKFMQLYTPSYEWLRQNVHKELLLDYLSDKLVKYRTSLRSQ